MINLTKERISEEFRNLQSEICDALEKEDGHAVFGRDNWERKGGGGGLSRAIQNGQAIEKGGVNYSAVHGELPPQLKEHFKIEKGNFYATGVSIVLHPQNPLAPTIHMNVRYFEMDNGVCWFGGGIDLTPSYVDLEEGKWFHQQMKNVCDLHDPTYYPKYKKWADEYFYITHRQETRGIGGVFFDHIMPGEKSKEELFNFVLDLGKSFAPTYTSILSKKKNLAFTDEHKDWQLIRRGRYVEFNLVLDRGTKFGLETDGRTESILMSMPAEAKWKYNHEPEPGSQEADSLRYFKKDINWI